MLSLLHAFNPPTTLEIGTIIITPIQLMGKLKFRRLSNLAKSQSLYLVELGHELRPCLGLETANIHNVLCLLKVLEHGRGLWRRLLHHQGAEPWGLCHDFPMSHTRFPGLAQPGGDGDARRKRLVNALPVHATIAGLSHVGEKSVTLDCGHGIRIGGGRGARSHPKETILRIDGPKSTC